MVVKQCVLHRTPRLFLSLKSITILTIALVALVLMPVTTKAENYGPVKKGQALWDIAREVRSDNSISIEQLIYSIYHLNPDAFNSGNMNLLQNGAILTIPDSDTVLKTPNLEAKKQLKNHIHAFDILRASAKQLRTARANSKNHQREVKSAQKKLGRYRHKSKAWNQTYRELVKSKRNYSRSKRRVAKIRNLLREKATLKLAQKSPPPEKDSAEDSQTMVVMTDSLATIQSVLESLNNSNSTLIAKVDELATLAERVNLLEVELGKHDELVIELKKTLETAQLAIEQQNKKSEELLQRFNEIETSLNTEAVNLIPTVKVEQPIDSSQNEESNIKITITQLENKNSASLKEQTNVPQEAPSIATETTDDKAIADTKEQSISPKIIDTALNDTSPEDMKKILETPTELKTPEPQDSLEDIVATEADKSKNDTPDIVPEELVIEQSISPEIIETALNKTSSEDTKAILEMPTEQEITESQDSTEDIVATEADKSKNDTPHITPDEVEIEQSSSAEESKTALNDSNPDDVKEKLETLSEPEVSEPQDSSNNINVTQTDTSNDDVESIAHKESKQNYTSVITLQADLLQSGTANSTKALRTNLTKTNFIIPGTSKTVLNHQRTLNGNLLRENASNYWISLFKNNIILIGALLNGLILIFVLFILFNKKQPQAPVKVNDSASNATTRLGYKSWQEREKPKQTR